MDHTQTDDVQIASIPLPNPSPLLQSHVGMLHKISSQDEFQLCLIYYTKNKSSSTTINEDLLLQRAKQENKK